MQRYNITKKLFDLEEDSEGSVDSVIYISSDSENEVSSSWDSDWSTDTEEIIERIEREVKAAPIPIVGRGMTTEELDDEMTAGPSSVRPVPPSPLNWDSSILTKKCAWLHRKSKENQKSSSVQLYYLFWSPHCLLPIMKGDRALTPPLCSQPLGLSMHPIMCKIPSLIRT